MIDAAQLKAWAEHECGIRCLDHLLRAPHDERSKLAQSLLKAEAARDALAAALVRFVSVGFIPSMDTAAAEATLDAHAPGWRGVTVEMRKTAPDRFEP